MAWRVSWVGCGGLVRTVGVSQQSLDCATLLRPFDPDLIQTSGLAGSDCTLRSGLRGLADELHSIQARCLSGRWRQALTTHAGAGLYWMDWMDRIWDGIDHYGVCARPRSLVWCRMLGTASAGVGSRLDEWRYGDCDYDGEVDGAS